MGKTHAELVRCDAESRVSFRFESELLRNDVSAAARRRRGQRKLLARDHGSHRRRERNCQGQ